MTLGHKLLRGAVSAALLGTAALFASSDLSAADSLEPGCVFEDGICFTLPATDPICLPDVGCVPGLPERDFPGRPSPQ